MALLTKKSVNEIDVAYMYALNKETKKIYAKLKQKNNESLTSLEKETLIMETVSTLKDYVISHSIDMLIVPESSNVILNLILSHLTVPIAKISKQNSDFVVNGLNAEKMQKAEKAKLMNSLTNVNSVKMAQLSANQRKRVTNHLFKLDNDSIFKNKRILFFDDALFTGSTLSAIQKLIPINNAFVMFSFD